MFSILVVYQWGVWENTRKFLQVHLNIKETSSLICASAPFPLVQMVTPLAH